MQMKKLVSAAAAWMMAVGAITGTGVFPAAAAADPTLTFDIRSNGQNAVEIKAEDIAARDITVPVQIFIPSNPGVNYINLKLQVNDGQIAEDGSFGNYGLYLTDGAMASPFCFDSASKGDPSASFSSLFTDKMMNLSWVYSQKVAELPDAAAEANTIKWDSSVNWAYDNAFVTANLVIPKGTAPGEYKLDIRKDEYINSLSSNVSGGIKTRSMCTNSVSDSEVSFESVPLTVKVDEAAPTKWDESYEIEGAGHYLIAGDVCGKPGETVSVPVYVFNDKGTAGLQVYFDINQNLELQSIKQGTRGGAYRQVATINTDFQYPCFTFATDTQLTAPQGAKLLDINLKIPEDAKEGTVYPVKFYHESEHVGEVIENDDNTTPPMQKIVDIDGVAIDVAFFDGSITVVEEEGKKMLNRQSATLSGPNEYCNLTLFNADGPVTWMSSAPEIATVDQNGFIKSVKYGTTTITATCGDQEYTCDVVVGMLGDVDRNGDVTSADAQIVLVHYTEVFAGNEGRIPPELYPLADVNGDGNVSVTDAQSILKYYVNNKLSGNDVPWSEVI